MDSNRNVVNRGTVLSEVLSLVPGCIFWKDTQLVFQGCNLQFAQQFGCKNEQEIIGRTDADFPWSQTGAKEKYCDDDLHIIKTGESFLNLEEEQVQIDGSIKTMLVSKVPLKNDSGEITGVLGSFVDITYLKNLEKSFKDAKEVAEAASRAKAEFLASMSHDVKTPLSGIIALSELLSKQPNAGIKQKGEDIYQCGKQLISFFDNCIELSKMDMAQLQDVSQSFSMAKIIESIHALFVPSATAKRLTFTVHHDEKLPAVLIGNQVNIYRVILNLVGNAIKFTSMGSVNVSVFLDRCVDDKNIFAKIIVQDTGMGIPKDKQQLIFEKLQRLAPSYYNKQEGHGIGLYIVDQYVQAMQGSIEVDSTVGVGSKFTVTIPLKVASPDETNVVVLPKISSQEVPTAQVTESVMRTMTPLQNQALKENAPHVLLVEDNLLIQLAMKEILQSTGAYVDVAGDGQEALSLFEPNKYALIYMDIGLSDMSGYETSKCIRAIEEADTAVTRVPIIALTAHTDVDVNLSCADAGMQGVMSKPLSCEQAEQVLERYVLKSPIIVKGLQVL